MEKVSKRLMEDLKEILDIEPTKINRKAIPEASGIYIFSIKDNVVYVGKATNLRERIYNNHLMGDSISGIKGKLMKKHNFTRKRAKEYIEKNFMVRFKRISSKSMNQIEHFAIAILEPKYND